MMDSKGDENYFRNLVIMAASVLLIGALIGFGIKSILPGQKVVPPSLRPIRDGEVYMLTAMDAFKDEELIALVPGLTGNYSHLSFIAFDRNGMHYVIVFYLPNVKDFSLTSIHEFTVGDPKLIYTVKYVGELTGKIYVWYREPACWIVAPYKHNPNPPPSCTF